MNSIDDQIHCHDALERSEVMDIIRSEARWFGRIVVRCAVFAVLLTTGAAMVKFFPGYVLAVTLGMMTGAAAVAFADEMQTGWQRVLHWIFRSG